MSKMPGAMIALIVVAGSVAASTGLRADDSLNSRVCHNIALSEHDRAACARDMEAAKSEDDRTKVRKDYEAKILEARAKKTPHAQ